MLTSNNNLCQFFKGSFNSLITPNKLLNLLIISYSLTYLTLKLNINHYKTLINASTRIYQTKT